MTPKADLAAIARWNELFPVTTPVRYWPGVRDGEPRTGVTRSTAQILGYAAVVWIEGARGAIALTHVDPVADPLVEISGGRRYHRPGCKARERAHDMFWDWDTFDERVPGPPWIEVSTVTVHAAEMDGKTPCRVCRPPRAEEAAA